MILVISGTEEGKEVVRRLHEAGVNLLTTVATDYGKRIFKEIGLEELCLQARLDANGFTQLIHERGVEIVVDASHPYAVETSNNAYEASKRTGIPYFRYERQQTTILESPFIHKVKSMDEAVEKARPLGKNIFLTTGVSSIAKFISLKHEKEIYVRILPIADHINHCVHLGIAPKNIIAMHGPFSEELNRAMFRLYRINTMVTKESGGVGGVREKINAALEEGVDVIIIERPHTVLTNVYVSVDDLVNAIEKYGLMQKRKVT